LDIAGATASKGPANEELGTGTGESANPKIGAEVGDKT
jgi:hypothetical protein